MPQFENCLLEVVTQGDEEDFRCEECDFSLEAGVIAVTYFDDEGPVVFAGHEVGPGHFELVCRSRPRVATLTRQGDQTSFEGTWEQQEEQGTWRIVLPPRAGLG